MNDKLKRLFSDSAGYLAVALVSLMYVLAGLFVPGLTGKSIYTIVAEGATGFALGVCMNGNLKLQGIMKTIYNNSVAAAERNGLGYNLVAGANIAGFERVADAMMAQGVF